MWVADTALIGVTVATALIQPTQPLAWEPPYATGVALKKDNKKKKKKKCNICEIGVWEGEAKEGRAGEVVQERMTKNSKYSKRQRPKIQ